MANLKVGPGVVLSVTARLPDLLQRARRLAPWPLIALLCACASTTVSVAPSPQAPLCDRAASALVLWAPQWRPDQKDVAAREHAAATGLHAFFDSSDCFRRVELASASRLTPAEVRRHVAAATTAFSSVIGIEVLELGPVVKLLSGPALIEGGTHVVLRIIEYSPESLDERRRFVVDWHHGGPGVVQGVESLPSDIQAAVRAGLQADAPR